MAKYDIHNALFFVKLRVIFLSYTKIETEQITNFRVASVKKEIFQKGGIPAILKVGNTKYSVKEDTLEVASLRRAYQRFGEQFESKFHYTFKNIVLNDRLNISGKKVNRV